MGLMTVLCIAGGLLIGFGLFMLLGKEGERKELVISLADLSVLWLGEALPPGRVETVEADGGEEEEPADALPVAVVEKTKSLWDDCIAPYLTVIDAQGARPVIEELLKLMEEHGHCPSVATGREDAESTDLYGVRDSLAKVSLKEHTFSVVRIMVDMVKEQYLDDESMMPLAITVGLAHDLGKIPQYRLTGVYNSHEHTLVSMGKLQELFAGFPVAWQKAALSAVRDHHSRSNDQLTLLLKSADQRARAMELAGSVGECEVMPFERWFDPERFLKEYVAPEINVAQTNKWQAFTLKGVVFVRPEFLFEGVKRMCRDMKVLEMGFVYESEKDGMVRRIVARLREGGYVHDMLPAGRSSLYFELKTSVGGGRKVKAVLVPLKGDAFDVLELEKRKTDFLSVLDDAIPA